MITGGLVLDTSIENIHDTFVLQQKARKSSLPAGALESTLSTLQTVGKATQGRFGLGSFGLGR